MQTTEKPKSRLDLGKALSTRNGTLLVSAISALLAGALLLVFLNQYRDSTADDNVSASVLVAKRLIERGSTGGVLAEEGMFQRAAVPKSELKDGAIVDASSLKDQVASTDIYPGEQLKSDQFRPVAPRAIHKLAADERAIAIPTDAVHGNTAELKAGDRVDILGGFNVGSDTGIEGRPVIKPLLRDVLVLRVPEGADSNRTGQQKAVVVKVPDDKAAQLAFTADNGKLWLLLRPQAGARDSRVPLVTLETVLFGTKPVSLERLAQEGQ